VSIVVLRSVNKWKLNQGNQPIPRLPQMSPPDKFEGVEALIFDVFGTSHLVNKLIVGTVVDWRKSVVDYLQTLPQPSEPLDHARFAQEWRNGYHEAISRFAKAPDPNQFKTVDEIHLGILKRLVQEYNLANIWNEELLEEINSIWHRLHGWDDATAGLGLLKQKYIIGTLSNGNVRLLVDMAKFAKLPWDVVFSGDLLKAYKPNKRTYLGACEYLQLPPEKVGMVRIMFGMLLKYKVAAHLGDLEAAKSFGLKTIYVKREGEDRDSTDSDSSYVDMFANSFIEVAHRLGISR